MCNVDNWNKTKLHASVLLVDILSLTFNIFSQFICKVTSMMVFVTSVRNVLDHLVAGQSRKVCLSQFLKTF